MSKSIYALLFGAALTAAAIEVDIPWNKGFETGKLRHSAGWNSKGVAIEKYQGKRVLKLEYPADTTDNSVIMKRVPVQERTKYELSFTAMVEGPDTIENNPQLAMLLYVANKAAKGKRLAGWRLTFYDEQNKKVGEKSGTWRCFVHSSPTKYQDVFFTPDRAAYMVLVIGNGKNNKDNIIRISDFRLETADEGSLNLNPEFRYGMYNLSGYGYGSKYQMAEIDGKTILDCGKGWCMGDSIPVKTGATYELSITARRGAERNANGAIWWKNGTKSTRMKTVLAFYNKDEFKTKKMQFKVPENSSWINIGFGYGEFQQVNLKEVKK